MSEGPGTRSVHGGEKPDPATGALNTPIYRTTTFRFDSTDDLVAEVTRWGLEATGFDVWRGREALQQRRG